MTSILLLKILIFTNMKLIGPFKQIVTLANLPLRGKLSDDQLEIIENGGILVENGIIADIGNFENYNLKIPNSQTLKPSNPQTQSHFPPSPIPTPTSVSEEIVPMILL